MRQYIIPQLEYKRSATCFGDHKRELDGRRLAHNMKKVILREAKAEISEWKSRRFWRNLFRKPMAVYTNCRKEKTVYEDICSA